MTNNKNTTSNSTNKSYNDMSSDERVTFQHQAFSSIKKMAIGDISSISRTSSFLIKFKIEQIAGWLQNPSQYEKQIRQLSQYLYNVSPHYRRLILYMAQMPLYAYTVEPVDLPDKIDVDKFKKQYKKALLAVEKMNLRHEMSKVAKVAFREDFYFGYVHESNDSFFLQKLNPDYCKISSIEDGVINFKFDFSIFDGQKDLIESYPTEFQQKYAAYKNSAKTVDSNWKELSSENTLTIKIQDDILEYGLPPFNIIFESVFDLDEYKRLKKSKAKADNFMTFIQKIPMDEKGNDVNKFLIDLELAAGFHDQAAEALPENIGIITSPMPIEAVKMDQSKVAQDLIANATRDVYSGAGVSQHLFNSDKTTSTGLSQSIITDEQFGLGFLRQVERWINRRLKKMSGQYKFNIRMLDITVFNQEDKFDMYLRGAQSGLPVINETAASLGLSPLDLLNKSRLESEILNLHDILKPLATAHTQSSKDKAGAKKLDDDEISDSGQVNRDANTDENKE